MNLKWKIVLPFLVFLIIAVPISIYTATANEQDNTTDLVNGTNTTADVGNNPVLNNNNLSQNNTKLLNVPDVRQPTDYSCGPTSLQAVLSYYGVDMRVEDLINMTHCTVNGTNPSDIASAAQNLGFNAVVKENMTLQDLQNYTTQGTPVIVDAQAWKSNQTQNLNWTSDEEDGHYMVVIGIDNENVYLEDPAILGSRGYINNQEFLDRWHDIYQDDSNNNLTTTRLGIIITGKEPVVRPLIVPVN